MHISRRFSILTGAALVAVLALAGCSTEPPSATGTIVELHQTQATVEQDCDVVSVEPYVEDCAKVLQPDQCFAYIEGADGGTVMAELWCDKYADLKVGDKFQDGTDVIDSICAYKDKNGRWGIINGDDCAEYKDGLGG